MAGELHRRYQESPKGKDKAAKDALAPINERETKLRRAAAGLATDPLFADLQPPHLRRADPHLADAVKYMGDTIQAQPPRPRKKLSACSAKSSIV